MSRLLATALPLLLIAAADCPDEAPPARCADGHTVAPHETLYRIARNCRRSVAAVAAASHVADPRHIAVGQRLIIPDEAAAPGKDDDTPPPRGPAPRIYSFAPGDTLYSLARWAHVSLRALFAANPGIDPHKIEIGEAIRLPAGAVAPEPQRLRERGPARMMPVALPPPPGPPPPPPPRVMPMAPPPMHVLPPPRPLPPPPPDAGKKDADAGDTPGV